MICVICRYRYESRTTLGPSTLPTCKTYEAVKQQFAKYNNQRKEDLAENMENLKIWEDEELGRKCRAESVTEEMKKEKLDKMAVQQEVSTHSALVVT